MLRKLFIAFTLIAAAMLPLHAGAQTATAVTEADTVNIDNMTVRQLMDSSVSDEFFDAVAERIDSRYELHEEGFLDRMGEEWIAALAILCVFGMPAVVVLIALSMILRHLSQHNSARNSLIEMSLRTGNPLPPEFYRRPRRDTRLNSALLWISWGLGLMIFFLVVGAESPAGLMAVPCFIGLSKLVVIYIESRRKRSENAEQD